ncbi:uncharacterized protein MELLADRAFT_68995 [Melampsora larici-populina 98AG31]|uniref:Uncharacterized protein n=1 Tax=Melampsora larici-populina (strain 98AG31 / pathotype 3-4-7) TaxID=747676 RepID=F4S911_MELLP|nr:uncharacterized protein MELLADRAFT_68995 [Melampsora larici-populina 98AG31]EGF98832.1 hypothetical protein MELLADRAFT_68995 [Melampsora larici-populina 98AG31]
MESAIAQAEEKAAEERAARITRARSNAMGQAPGPPLATPFRNISKPPPPPTLAPELAPCSKDGYNLENSPDPNPDCLIQPNKDVEKESWVPLPGIGKNQEPRSETVSSHPENAEDVQDGIIDPLSTSMNTKMPYAQ